MLEAKTNGFRWLPSYYNALRNLPDEERLKLYDAVSDFGFGNEVGELPPLLAGFFGLIKPTLERSIRFEEKQAANGKLGGRPRKNPTETQNGCGFSHIDAQTEGSGNLAVAFAAADTFVHDIAEGLDRAGPALEEVQEFFSEQGLRSDPRRFWNFYRARGWRIDGQPVADWRALARTWESREKNLSSPPLRAAEPESQVVDMDKLKELLDQI